jgi:hypothetical protein
LLLKGVLFRIHELPERMTGSGIQRERHMERPYRLVEIARNMPLRRRGLKTAVLGACLGVGLATAVAISARATADVQEELLFPAIHNVQSRLLEKISAERVRIDVATWQFTERAVSAAILNAHRSGVPVRVIGDRAAIFESGARREFEYLAAGGVPIRLRYHPTSFPEAMHWKCGIFVGQNTVEFGSANWTPFELKPSSTTNFKDETALFTNDPPIVNAFRTMFDRMWADQVQFMDWPAAYERETGTPWTTPMTISTARLEPEHPTELPDMVWSQGAALLDRMIAEAARETRRIDVVSYRLSSSRLTDALLAKFQSGVPLRVIVEPREYRNGGFPEYWLTGAMTDRMWAAGVPIRQRLHAGLTHMKTIITSAVAMNGSSNFTRNWQRDHNYFIPAPTKPALYQALANRFELMWNDGTNFGAFTPRPPTTPVLSAPAGGATALSTTPRLVWKRTPWAVSFDVYLGTTSANLAFAGRVNAVLNENPPATYSWQPAAPLQRFTRYYWRVVARTFASDLDPSLVKASTTSSFTTGDPSVPPAVPSTPCITAEPKPTMVCVNGAWVPRG